MSYTMPTFLPPPSRLGSERELRNRIPRLHTSDSDMKNTLPTASTTQRDATSIASAEPKSPSNHQRFCLTDHVAFRYLEEDSSITVLARHQKLQGYEIYLVEQWACSRTHPTFIITTYTGDPKDSVDVSVIGIPADENAWSPQFRIYLKTLGEYHARPKDTSLGRLMITNLSSFPSSLTIIPVPDGDMTKHRELFFVNENLKRLGCSGRLGIKLAPPSSATQAKFHQLYRTSDKIPLNSSVIELVKLCQAALVLFGKLEPEYADGLLCDVTERAINDWWIEFGAEYYTVEPHDGILGPTTVAALLGMLIGARNRLSAFNAPVAKDVFDVESTKRAIAHFQKTQRIQKTRRLDRHTLERLRRATAKAASKEGWGVPRAFKSTVAELGGKGGEMVMGMVGAGEKAGIAEIETVDFDRFVELLRGERAKWLWYGKPRKSNTNDMFSRLPNDDRSNSPDEQQSAIATLLKRESTLENHGLTKRDTTEEDANEKDPNSKRAAIKRATEKIESGTGFTRIKDAVGRRTHQPKPSRDERGRLHLHHIKSDVERVDGAAKKDNSSPVHDGMSETTSATSAARGESLYEPSFTKALTETPRNSGSTLAIAANSTSQSRSDDAKPSQHDESEASKPPTVDNSIAGSVYRGVDLNDKLPFADTQEIVPLLRRTQSSEQLGHYHASSRNENWWPRHLSFSIAEESVLTWPPLISLSVSDQADMTNSTLHAQLMAQESLSTDFKNLRQRLALLSSIEASWTESAVQAITSLDAQAEADHEELEQLYYPRLEEYHSLREDAHEIISRERLQVQEALRDLETLGAKLEYELGALRGKVEDVEDGVAELERQVETVEAREQEMQVALGKGKKEGWLHWFFRISTGIGRAPTS